MEFKKGERVRSNEMYSKIYSLWNNTKERCYNQEHPKYKNYGAKGVRMSEEWKDFNAFARDIDKVKGYSRKKILAGELTLDKDASGNKMYSLEHCKFISRTANNRMKPNQQFRFDAISPDGKIYKGITNQRQFCEEHKLNQSNISKILNDKRQTNTATNGWKFIKK